MKLLLNLLQIQLLLLVLLADFFGDSADFAGLPKREFLGML